MELEESDLKRRLNAAQRYKETLKDCKIKTQKLEFALEKLTDKMEFYKDDLDTCKIDLLAAKQIEVKLNISPNKVKIIYLVKLMCLNFH